MLSQRSCTLAHDGDFEQLVTRIQVCEEHQISVQTEHVDFRTRFNIKQCYTEQYLETEMHRLAQWLAGTQKRQRTSENKSTKSAQEMHHCQEDAFRHRTITLRFNPSRIQADATLPGSKLTNFKQFECRLQTRFGSLILVI